MIDESHSSTTLHPPVSTAAPIRSSIDDIVALYMKDVDRTMLRENLRKSVTERLECAARAMAQMAELYEAGRRHRGEV